MAQCITTSWLSFLQDRRLFRSLTLRSCWASFLLPFFLLVALPRSRSSNAHLFFNDQKKFPMDQTVSVVEMSHLLGDVFCRRILIKGISEESCVNQSRAAGRVRLCGGAR